MSVVCKTEPGETEPTTVPDPVLDPVLDPVPDPVCGGGTGEEEHGFVVKEEEKGISKEMEEATRSSLLSNVQQFSLPEPLQIEEEQEQQSDITDSIFTSPRVKTHCEAEDSSQLPPPDQTPTVENSGDSLPTSTTGSMRPRPTMLIEVKYGHLSMTPLHPGILLSLTKSTPSTITSFCSEDPFPVLGHTVRIPVPISQQGKTTLGTTDSTKTFNESLFQHFNESIDCQSSYDMDLLRKEIQTAERTKRRACRAEKVARDAQGTQELEHLSQPVKDLCRTCKKKINKSILQHLNKSINCQSNYDMDLLRKEMQAEARMKKRARRAEKRARDAQGTKAKDAAETCAHRARNMSTGAQGTRAQEAAKKHASRAKSIAMDAQRTKANEATRKRAYRAKNIATDAQETRAKEALKRRMYLQRLREKDPKGTRAKKALRQRIYMQRLMEKDAKGTRAKEALRKRMYLQRRMEKDAKGTRAKEAERKRAYRAKKIATDAQGTRAKEAERKRASRASIIAMDAQKNS